MCQICKKQTKILQKNNIYVKILLKIGKEIYKMKEASGELNMTLITIVAVAALAAIFAALYPTLKNTILNQWSRSSNSAEIFNPLTIFFFTPRLISRPKSCAIALNGTNRIMALNIICIILLIIVVLIWFGELDRSVDRILTAAAGAIMHF